MMRWLKRNAPALQVAGTIVTSLAAIAALVGVKVQIDASAKLQREQSARDIYREFLNLSISRPEFADPDYCAIAGTSSEGAYENYVEYMLYTAEQLVAASPQWEPTLAEHFGAHRELLCRPSDWSDDSPAIQKLIGRYRAAKCGSFKPACPS
jgi:hypothetical protein